LTCHKYRIRRFAHKDKHHHSPKDDEDDEYETNQALDEHLKPHTSEKDFDSIKKQIKEWRR